MKQVRFFHGFIMGVVFVLLLAVFIAVGDVFFPRNAPRIIEMVFLGILGVMCGKLSLKAQKLENLEFWEGWGMLLGIFMTAVLVRNVAPDPIVKSAVMSICFVFGRWLELEKLKRRYEKRE